MFWVGMLVGVLVMAVPLTVAVLGWRDEYRACDRALVGWGETLDRWKHWQEGMAKPDPYVHRVAYPWSEIGDA